MSPAEIYEFITKYGPGSIFLVLYWLERGERRDAQAEVRTIANASIAAMTKLEATVGHLSQLFGARSP